MIRNGLDIGLGANIEIGFKIFGRPRLIRHDVLEIIDTLIERRRLSPDADKWRRLCAYFLESDECKAIAGSDQAFEIAYTKKGRRKKKELAGVWVNRSVMEALIDFLGVRQSVYVDIDEVGEVGDRMISERLKCSLSAIEKKVKVKALSRIYLIADTQHNVCKIGISTNVEQRLNNLQTAYPYPLSIIGSFEGTLLDEFAAHKKYFKHKLSGEWFSLTDEIRNEFTGGVA